MLQIQIFFPKPGYVPQSHEKLCLTWVDVVLPNRQQVGLKEKRAETNTFVFISNKPNFIFQILRIMFNIWLVLVQY